jgi:hypothetical protein
MGTASGTSGQLVIAAFVVGLVLSAALVATLTTGSGRIVALVALVVAALAGQFLRDWREALIVGLGVSALVAWCTRDTGQVLAPALTTLCIVVNAAAAAWNRAGVVASDRSVRVVMARSLALPAPSATSYPRPDSSDHAQSGSSGDPLAGLLGHAWLAPAAGTARPLLREAEAVLSRAQADAAPHARHSRVA